MTPLQIYIGLAILLVGATVHALFEKRLWRYHRPEWRSLYPVEEATSSPMPSDANRINFYFTRQYRHLHDPVLTALGDLAILVSILFLVLALDVSFHFL